MELAAGLPLTATVISRDLRAAVNGKQSAADLSRLSATDGWG